EVRHRRGRCGERGGGAGGLEARGDAAFEPAAENIEAVSEALSRAPRDLELEVELQQFEIGLGHVAYEREHDTAPGLFAREDLSARRLVGAPDASPEIDLPSGV